MESGNWGDLNFLAVSQPRPAFHVHDRARDRMRLQRNRVRILNGRSISSDLDVEGFTLTRAPPVETDWFASEAQQIDPVGTDWEACKRAMKAYSSAAEQIVILLTGARFAFATPVGAVRVSERSAQEVRSAAHRPARFVHSDFTDLSAEQWAGTIMGKQRALCKRVAVYNVWRPLTNGPQDSSLALCDSRTADPEDQVSTDAIQDYPGMPSGVFEATTYRHNPRQVWYYFPMMSTAEIVLFKGFDSDSSRANRVPHTAFDDHTCPQDAPSRVSIDFRVLAGFV